MTGPYRRVLACLAAQPYARAAGLIDDIQARAARAQGVPAPAQTEEVR